MYKNEGLRWWGISTRDLRLSDHVIKLYLFIEESDTNTKVVLKRIYRIMWYFKGKMNTLHSKCVSMTHG